MTPPRVVLDTNVLLQILGARSPYHFLFRAFLDGAFCPFPRINVMSLDAFADLIRSAPGQEPPPSLHGGN